MFNSIRADTIARLKNAYKRKLELVQLSYSKEVINFIDVLKNCGYIKGYDLIQEENSEKKVVIVTLSYVNNQSGLKSIKIVSKSGQRKYVKCHKIPVITNGFGSGIISTNQGIMTSQEAKKRKIGGELLAVVF